MLYFLIGGAGCGKSYSIIEMIKEKTLSGCDVLALVPEQFSYEFDRKLYNCIGSKLFNSIETHSFTSLSRDIFRRFGGESGTYMNELMQTALVLKAIAMSRGQLSIFGKRSERSEFANEVIAVISLLRRSGISSEYFSNKCQNLKGKLLDKISDIAIIYHYYEMLIAKHNLNDMLTDITEAAAIANGNDFFAGKTIFIDEFESFTPDQYEMLSVIIGLAENVYIAFRMESEDESEMSLFASVGSACRRVKHIASEHHIEMEFILFKNQYRMRYSCMQQLSETIFRPRTGDISGSASHIHVFEALTPSDETEYISATIKRLLAERSDLKCRDIAVVTNELTYYAGMIEHSMKRYGLPFHIDMPKPLIHTPFMVYLTSLTELISMKAPSTDLLLKCGKSGFTDLTLLELSELENYCYIWNIDGSMWNEAFTMGKEAEKNECLREKLIAPFMRFYKLCSSCVTGNDYSRAVYEFLTEENIGIRAAKLFSCGDEIREMHMKQDFKRVWDSLMDILDVIAFLYEEQSCSAKEYFSFLNVLLRTVSHSVPPRTLDAVFIGPARTSRLSEPKITFVLGVCDGSFPMNSYGNILFSERDRLELLEQDMEIGQSPEIDAADERLAVYKILSSASEELYLCYSLKDNADKKRLRSNVINHTLSLFRNKNEILTTQNHLTTAYYALTKEAAYYHYVRDFSKRSSDIASIQTVLYEDKYYANRIDYLKNVHKDIDFTVSPDLMENLIGTKLILSSSQLESYSMCPFQYFCKYILRIFERRKVKLEALERGNLVHLCLETLIKNTSREKFISMTPKEIKSYLNIIANKYWEEELGGTLHQSIRDTASFKHIKDGVNFLAMRLQEEFKQSLFYPEFMESEISDRSPHFPSTNIITDLGHIISIKGKIDRIDVFHSDNENWVRVIDYKTGSKNFSLSNIAYGLDMQMLLYLFTVIGQNSKLSGSHPAGVLYMPAGIPECNLERGSILTASDALKEQYKMNGIFIDDKKIVGAMDKKLSGTYISASLNKDGTSFKKTSGTFLSEQQFEKLSEYTKNKLKSAADSIYSGNIAVDPLVLSGRDACEFCTFKDICGNGDKHKCRKPIESMNEIKKRIMKELE